MQRTCRIVIGGDLCPTPKNFDSFQKGRIEDIVDQKILQLFDTADFSVCNLEGALTDTEHKGRKCGPSIKAPTATIAGIEKLGISCVSLANNHVMDYGKQGFLDTCETLRKGGIAFFGAGETSDSIQPSLTITMNGLVITFYAVAETMFNRAGLGLPGVNLYDEYRVIQEIKELKAHCDKLLVLYHGGPEFYRYPSKELTQRFHRMADNGADLIVSQHSHAIGAFERYRGSYLLYGQGDFLLARHENEYTAHGLLLELTISEEHMTVKPHLLSHTAGTVNYDLESKMEDFYRRSEQLTTPDVLEQEYRTFCDQKMKMYLEAFRGKNLKDKIFRKILSREKYLEYLKKQYEEEQILRILHTIRCEEHSEQAIQGCLDWLEACFDDRNRGI